MPQTSTEASSNASAPKSRVSSTAPCPTSTRSKQARHHVDLAEVERFRALLERRRLSMGLTMRRFRSVGLHNTTIGKMVADRKVGTRLSIMNRWCNALSADLIISLGVDEPEPTPEQSMMVALAASSTDPGLRGQVLLDRLRAVRESAMSTRDMAWKLGVEVNSVRSWENRAGDMWLPTAERYIRACGGRLKYALEEWDG